METNEIKQGKDLVVEDGHPASFRNADGSMKSIYSDDGNLTEEGRTIILLRETLSKETHAAEKENKTNKRKRKGIIWAVSAGVVVFFLLFFHIYISSGGGIEIFAKSVPTFSNTFINGHEVNDVLQRYNNASIFEQTTMRNEPFVKLLFEKGILYDKKNVDVNLDAIKDMVNNSLQGQKSLKEQIESIIKNKYGSKWHILNDKQANWDEFSLENFILPERDKNPDYPYIVKGDFDGNGKLDYAATFSDSNSLMSKIAIILDNGNIHFLELYPQLYGIDCISKQKISSVYGDVSVTLKGDGIELSVYEAYSSVIYWNGNEFESIATSD